MKTISNILVPIDFSACAINAFNVALDIATKKNANITLIHVFSTPYVDPHGVIPVELSISEYQKELEERMDEFIQNHHSDKVELKSIIEVGFTVEVILEELKKNTYQLLVVGTHGASGLEEKILGSNTEVLIEKSACPVLAIPEDAHFNEINNILLAYDYKGMNDAEELDSLVEIAHLFDAKIRILYINKKMEETTPEVEQNVNILHHNLEGVEHQFVYMLDKDISGSILTYAKEHAIDMIAIMPKEHSLFGKIFKESISKTVVNHAKRPIFAFHDH